MPGEDKKPEVSRKVALRAVDERVARLAIRQHGAFTRQQARKEGSADEVIAGRLATGRWLRTDLRGVYRIAGHPVTWQHRAMVACLSSSGTVASHLTAAALIGLGAAPDTPL